MSGRAAKAEEILRGVLADPALAPGPQLVARAYLAACVQFRPHPEIYLEEGIRMLRSAEGAGQRQRARPHPHDGSPDDLRPRHGVDRAGALLPRRRRGGGDLAASGRSTRPGARTAPTACTCSEASPWQRRGGDDSSAPPNSSTRRSELARELQLLNHPAPADAHLARALVAIQRGEPEAGAFALHEGHVRASSNGRVQLQWIAHAESRLIDPEGTDAAAAPPIGSPAASHRAQRPASHRPPADTADGRSAGRQRRERVVRRSCSRMSRGSWRPMMRAARARGCRPR